MDTSTSIYSASVGSGGDNSYNQINRTNDPFSPSQNLEHSLNNPSAAASYHTQPMQLISHPDTTNSNTKQQHPQCYSYGVVSNTPPHTAISTCSNGTMSGTRSTQGGGVHVGVSSYGGVNINNNNNNNNSSYNNNNSGFLLNSASSLPSISTRYPAKIHYKLNRSSPTHPASQTGGGGGNNSGSSPTTSNVSSPLGSEQCSPLLSPSSSAPFNATNNTENSLYDIHEENDNDSAMLSENDNNHEDIRHQELPRIPQNGTEEGEEERKQQTLSSNSQSTPVRGFGGVEMVYQNTREMSCASEESVNINRREKDQDGMRHRGSFPKSQNVNGHIGGHSAYNQLYNDHDRAMNNGQINTYGESVASNGGEHQRQFNGSSGLEFGVGVVSSVDKEGMISDGGGGESRISTTTTMCATLESALSSSHFNRGSVIELSNKNLKRIENITTEDLMQSTGSNCLTFAKVSNITVVHNDHHSHSESSDYHQQQTAPRDSSQRIEVTLESDGLSLTTTANVEQPFISQSEGWVSASPSLTSRLYGLDCQPIKHGTMLLIGFKASNGPAKPNTIAADSALRPSENSQLNGSQISSSSAMDAYRDANRNILGLQSSHSMDHNGFSTACNGNNNRTSASTTSGRFENMSSAVSGGGPRSAFTPIPMSPSRQNCNRKRALGLDSNLVHGNVSGSKTPVLEKHSDY